jgi:hypothetical protein
MLAAIGQVPLVGVLVWHWCDGTLGTTDLERRYNANLETAGQIASIPMAYLLGAAATVGGISAVIWAWEHWGPVLTIIIGAIAGSMLMGLIGMLAGLVGMLTVGLSAISFGMPIASMITIFSRTSTPERVELTTAEVQV